MKIKRFVAPDMRQAMRQVRDEQGPDAVILSTRRLVTVDGVVELRKTYKVRAGQVVKYGEEEISVLPEVD